MKIILLLLHAFLCLFGQSLSGQILEIHQVNVGQGDATMIIIRDTARLRDSFAVRNVPLPANPYKWLETAIDSSVNLKNTVKKAILIDAGASQKTGTAVFNYKNKVGVDTFNYFILSHYHDDHYAGFKTLMETYKVYADTFIIRNPSFNKPKGALNKILKLHRDTGRVFLNAIHNQTHIYLGTEGGQPIYLTCIGSSLITAFQPSNKTLLATAKKDENNCSALWALQFGAFRYYTGGDVNGYTDKGKNPKKIDLETSLVDSLLIHDPANVADTNGLALNKAHFCSLKLNHHGGEESNNPYFLAVMKPSTAMISCGVHGHLHPRKRVLEDLDGLISTKPQWDISAYKTKRLVAVNGSDTLINKTIQQYFMTNLDTLTPKAFYNKIGKPAESKGIIGGDIVTVVNSLDPLRSAYYVFWNGVKGVAVTTNFKRLKVPNDKGGKYIKCHQSATGLAQPYLKNQ